MDDFPNWVFPPRSDEEGQPAQFGSPFFGDVIRLDWTPRGQNATVLLACDQPNGCTQISTEYRKPQLTSPPVLFIGKKSFSSAPADWQLLEETSDNNPDCHFAFSKPGDGNGKFWQYIHTTNPEGTTTWSNLLEANEPSNTQAITSQTAEARTTAEPSPSFTSMPTSTSAQSPTSTSTPSPRPTSIQSPTSIPAQDATSTPAQSATSISNPIETPKLEQKKSTNKAIIGVGVGIGVPLIGSFLAIFFLLYRRRKRKRGLAVPTHFSIGRGQQHQVLELSDNAKAIELPSTHQNAYELPVKGQRSWRNELG